MFKTIVLATTAWAVLSAGQPPGALPAGLKTHVDLHLEPGPKVSPTAIIFVNCAEMKQGAKPALSIMGRAQAGHLVKFLENEPVAAIYSPYNQCLVETVAPLAESKGKKVEYYRDACEDNPEVMRHILETMLERNDGKTIVVCAPSKSIKTMAKMLGIREKDLKYSSGVFNEVLIVNVLGFGEAVAQKLNMNFQKKV
ncbi:hypothetical protein ACFOTA_18455 [Chitinophaga sp. GCM10012297]|uniref:Broad specificity phosphatase PhoE n=1 Tax=Chitinophaga chungangae TaxID=2821488 RepID=A0ABS3YHN5_9BACT|nr:hypothetical protein [Chitinophaga chungangae]MBO9154203.1 hypothetical protein [Chitinophaga chungangae]